MSEMRATVPKRWANPALLKWARVQVGLDIAHVASLAKVAPDRVEQWERATDYPTLAELEVLADLYAIPVGYFFLDAPPHTPLTLELRGLANDKADKLSYETHMRLREFLRLSDYADYLVERLGLPWRVNIGTASLGEPVEEVARRERVRLGFDESTRRRWCSPADAFDFWRGAIESLGVFVIALKLDPREVRGASRWTAPSPPTILVNRDDSEAATGRTFTLLHEFAHLLVKRPGVVCDFQGHEDHAQVERFANRFAAEVLVTKEEFGDLLRNEGIFAPRARWGDETLSKIRDFFKVSKDVVAILLEDMQLAPPGFYRSKRSTWDRRKQFFPRRGASKGGLTLAARRGRELGLPLARLAVAGYRRGTISKLDLADLLDMRVEQAKRFVRWIEEKEAVPPEGK